MAEKKYFWLKMPRNFFEKHYIKILRAKDNGDLCGIRGTFVRCEYPQGKQEITGTSYEPWHYRYVGVDAAREIYERGICLEEYFEQ